MRKKLIAFLDLTSDLDDEDEIHTSITNGVIFKGTNLWILVFAIIVASVGLNTNSTAVIIGAMLISPLMGPINGMGYSIATYDFILFRRALKNFAFAVSASLAASTLYFLITPISTAHSELLARTSPTIYDVLIALFGGLAGILAISSKHKGNVIPGVAIATALMPPLCTAGFGLATGQFKYFFGAFYLFTINTVFIGISSVLFSQFLSFPIRTLVEPAHKRRVNRWISLVIAVTLIPSLYFGYVLVEKEKFIEKSGLFLASVGALEGSYLLRHNVDAAKKTIELTYGGTSLSEANKASIEERARAFGLENTQLFFKQGFSFNSVSDNLSDNISRIDNALRTELNRLEAKIQNNKAANDSVKNAPLLGKQLLQEIKPLFPEVLTISYATSVEYIASSDTVNRGPDSVKISMVTLGLTNKRLREAERNKLEGWVRARLQVRDSLKVVFVAEE